MYSLHKIIVTLAFILLSATAYCGNPFGISAGAGEAGRGSVCVMRAGFWSSFRNQALLAFNKSFLVGINYENRFGISELGTCTAGTIIPAGKSSLGIICSNFGYPEFRRNTLAASCGLSLTGRIAAGVQVDYFSERVRCDNEVMQALTFETGILYLPSEKVIAGIHLFNPLPNSFRKSFLPSVLTAGAGIELSKSAFAGAEAEMIQGEKLTVRTGFEYEAGSKLWLRGGFSSENTSFSFGIGYIMRSLKIDLSFTTHERLGVTSSVSLIYKIR